MTTELMKQLNKSLTLDARRVDADVLDPIVVQYQDGAGQRVISLGSIKAANEVTVMVQDVLNHVNARNMDVRVKTKEGGSYIHIPRSQYSDRPVMVGDEVYLAAYQRGA